MNLFSPNRGAQKCLAGIALRFDYQEPIILTKGSNLQWQLTLEVTV
jgi:hypothetical protein